MSVPAEPTPEQRLVELLERGRSIEVIKQHVGWSTFEVRECAAHHGYEFDKEGCPHPVARAASARRTAPNPAYPVAQPHEALTGPAFVPSPAPARRVHDDDCGFVGDRHDGPCLPPHVVITDTVPGGRPVAGIVGHTPVVTVDEDAVVASVWLDWLRRAQASTDKAVAAALARAVTRIDRLGEVLIESERLDAQRAAAREAEEARRVAAAEKLAKAERALARAREEAKAAGIRTGRALPAGAVVPGSDRDLKLQRQRIRGWGRDNGWPELSQTGRIPADVTAAYHAAHPTTP